MYIPVSSTVTLVQQWGTVEGSQKKKAEECVKVEKRQENLNLKSCLKCDRKPAVRARKEVHFGEKLECVKFFFKGEIPLACRQQEPEALPSKFDLRSFVVRGPANRAKELERKMVSLDSVITDTKTKILIGNVKVQNICFEKVVEIRYTFDRWNSVSCIKAEYIESITSSTQGGPPVDVFRFRLPLSVPLPSFGASLTVTYCICYKTNGGEFWDNNSGLNYEHLLSWKARSYTPLQSHSLLSIDSDSDVQSSDIDSESSTGGSSLLARAYRSHGRGLLSAPRPLRFADSAPSMPRPNKIPSLEDTKRYMEISSATFQSGQSFPLYTDMSWAVDSWGSSPDNIHLNNRVGLPIPIPRNNSPMRMSSPLRTSSPLRVSSPLFGSPSGCGSSPVFSSVPISKQRASANNSSIGRYDTPRYSSPYISPAATLLC